MQSTAIIFSDPECRSVVAQSIERPSKIPVWCNSANWHGFESRQTDHLLVRPCIELGKILAAHIWQQLRYKYARFRNVEGRKINQTGAAIHRLVKNLTLISSFRTLARGGASGGRTGRNQKLPWYRKPIVSNAFYTDLQRGSWHIGFYTLVSFYNRSWPVGQ